MFDALCSIGPRNVGVLQVAVILFIVFLSAAGQSAITCNQQTTKIKIGVSKENKSPFQRWDEEQDAPSKNTFELAIIQEVCDSLLWNCTYVGIPSLEETEQALVERKVDVIIRLLTAAEARESQIQFIYPYYYAAYPAMYYLQKENSTSREAKLPSNTKLCVQNKYYMVQQLKNFYNYPLELVNNVNESVKHLRNESCDFVVGDSSLHLDMINLGLKLSPEHLQYFTSYWRPYGIAVSIGSPLYDELSYGVMQLMQSNKDGQVRIIEMEEKYIRDQTVGQIKPNKYLQATILRQQVLQNSVQGINVLKIGQVLSSNPPFRKYDTLLEAFDPLMFEYQLGEAICRYLHKQCVWVPLGELEERFSSLEKGHVDIVISTFTANVARAKRVHFVEPHYYAAGVQLYVPKLDMPLYQQQVTEPLSPDSNEQLEWADILTDRRLCVIQGHYYVNIIKKSTSATIVNVANQVDAVDSVRGGRCHILMQDSGFAYAMDQAGLSPVPSLPQKAEAPYGIATKKGDTKTIEEVSSAMQAILGTEENSQWLELQQQFLMQQTNNVVLPNEYVACSIQTLTLQNNICSRAPQKGGDGNKA